MLPTLDTLAKVKNLAIQNQWQISAHDTYCLSIPIEKSRIEIFLLSVYGQLNGPEQANTKITTTDSQMTLDYEAIGRLIHLDVLGRVDLWCRFLQQFVCALYKAEVA